MAAPRKSILDPSFRYVPSAETDLRKTFARARRKMLEAERERRSNAIEVANKLIPIKAKT